MTEEEQIALIKKREECVEKYFKHHRAIQTLKKLSGDKPLTRKQEVLSEYGRWLAQVESAHSRLERYPIWLSSTNSAVERRGISRVDQFTYHIENYLAAVYILNERVRRLVSYLEKRGGRKRCNTTTIESLRKARRTFMLSLDPLMEIRRRHTHEKHFNDKELTTMEMADKAGEFSKDPSEKKQFKGWAIILLRFQRHRWKKMLKNNNRNFSVLLGMIYEPADKLVWEIYQKT